MKKESQNRLASEKSPYLLQHKNNPVDWFPWGEEAFAKARAEEKPVFLSIGYSTCHWCHVMEKESFEDKEVARVLNDHYVSIKVDREERPDIDHIYMSVCQALTGQGGWPLTVIMTPDKKPFFAGTYFPKEDKWGRPGLLTILGQVKNAWTMDPVRLIEIGEQLTRVIQYRPVELAGEPAKDILEKGFEQLCDHFDPLFGGFGEAPKFPASHQLMFLLRYHKQSMERQALQMVEKSLTSMYKGGVYDHLGYGFSRYSTDKQWLIPHFEKMLYDNALLAYAYLETYQVTKNYFYARVAKEVFAYILRELTSPQGGVYSAEDADSEGVEGKFYVWSPLEVKEILGEKEADVFCRLYDITPDGNFEGKNIPNLIKSGLKEHPLLLEALQDTEDMRYKLFLARKERVHPAKDDKILTSWNGLTIAALARGARILQNVEFIQAAARAVTFIWNNMYINGMRLLLRYRDGEAAFKACLDDYAFFIWGLIELYEATFDSTYLKKALVLTGQMISLFWDGENGGFFFSGNDAEPLLARSKELYDGALPSGNSVAAFNLLRLARFTGNQQFNELAWRQMRYFAGQVNRFPQGYTFFLTAWQLAFWPPKEIIVVGKRENEDTALILRTLQKEFLPEAILIFYPEGEANEELLKVAPFLKNYSAINGKTAVYICENYACRSPITDFEQLSQIIGSSKSKEKNITKNS
ncbi:MAG TPA: thioredoxin domain-containing protein [Desulfotomaculum sp.]|nr:thioredoxin domain-containing protein [Desulfotomaculum sp.]